VVFVIEGLRCRSFKATVRWAICVDVLPVKLGHHDVRGFSENVQQALRNALSDLARMEIAAGLEWRTVGI
jgi:hypothetical protein